MINIHDLDCLEIATEASKIYGGNRRTTNRFSGSPNVTLLGQFINARQNINANANGVGNVAIALGINIVNITNIFL